MADLTDRERIAALERELKFLQAENTELRTAKTDSAPRRPFPWRVMWSRVFVVLGLLVIIPAGLLIWLNRTITNTDQYVATVGPVIHEPAVQKAITQAATTQIFSQVDIQQEVTNLLPEQAKPLAGPISSQVEGFITKSITTIVSSEQFATLWLSVNRQAQVGFMKVAEGSGNPVVDVNQLYGFISTHLEDTPLAPLAGRQLPPQLGQIQIANVPALAHIPHYVATLSTLRWVFFGGALACLILAIAIAKDRRRVTVLIGIGWIIAVVMTYIIVRVTRGIMLAQFADPVYRDAAAAIWQALLKPFAVQSAVLLLTGAAVALVGWLMGPARPAVFMRGQSEHALGTARMSTFPALEASGFVSFLRRHHESALWLLLALAVVLILSNVPLAPVELAWIAAGELLILLILEFFVAPAPEQQTKMDLPV